MFCRAKAYFRIGLLLGVAAAAHGEEPSIKTIMATVGGYAAAFDAAAGWVAQENMIQRGFSPPKRHSLRAAFSEKPEKPEMVTLGMTGLYGFTSDPAIHEVRLITAVDGRLRRSEESLFESAIREGNERVRRRLLDEFDGLSINVAATDFGPLLALFTRGRQTDYDFTPAGMALIGADRVVLVRYQQKSGRASLHLKDGSHRGSAALTGQIEVRDSDFAPLRITLRSTRGDVRDEAEVEYVPRAAGLMLPVSIVYRRYVKDDLVAENRSRISAWHKLGAGG